jgi:hypothetical protein
VPKDEYQLYLKKLSEKETCQEHLRPDFKLRKHIFENPLISELLNICLFGNKADRLGVAFDDIFSAEAGIPLPTIAFIVTLVQ